MIKVLFIFGTRPEAIKLAPLVLELKSRDDFDAKVCVTGQHRQMLDQVMSLFEIEADFDLNIMKPGQSLTDITIAALAGLEPILKENKFDIALVQGDTTTAMIGALASFYQQVKVGHVEAGLRTYNRYSPWPEEVNRQMASRIADFHFAPTEVSQANLLQEKIEKDAIMVTGNTVIDALFSVLEKFENDEKQLGAVTKVLKSGGYLPQERKFVLITGHRRENFGTGFENICLAIKELANKHASFDFVYPVHMNPNVRKPVNEILGSLDNVFLTEPVDYGPFVYLMSKAHIILTDSGGIQEEAPSLGKPVLVMRDNTERPEAVDSGTVKLVGTDTKVIVKNLSELIENPETYKSMSGATNPYGDGKAKERIADFLLEQLRK